MIQIERSGQEAHMRPGQTVDDYPEVKYWFATVQARSAVRGAPLFGASSAQRK